MLQQDRDRLQVNILIIVTSMIIVTIVIIMIIDPGPDPGDPEVESRGLQVLLRRARSRAGRRGARGRPAQGQSVFLADLKIFVITKK